MMETYETTKWPCRRVVPWYFQKADMESSMSVRAKMSVVSIDKSTETGGGGTVQLAPVIDGSKENAEFYKYTPSGSLILSTINQAAFDQFAFGKEYYIDISPAG